MTAHQAPTPPTPPRRPAASIAIPSPCQDLIDRGALVAINHSGGKDSQAMTIQLARQVPINQLVAVHAPLAEVEWPGTLRHIETTLPAGIPLILAHIASGETLLDRIERRGRFPDRRRRYCTSDFKRTPIERELRRYLKANPCFGGRIVNAMGIRRDESPDRAKRDPWQFNHRNSRAGRQWYDWLPIFDHDETQVFRTIRAAGQTPHPVYGLGLSRCSCSFCIFGSRADLATAARLRPDLYRRYVRLERKLGHSLSPSRQSLPEITGIQPERASHPARATDCHRQNRNRSQPSKPRLNI
ncbi:MAG: phosphoadenosine phosphosulfate reductase family protein [Defluviicoccus sp.]|nr:phosphoadenosine phosphosulfate reductase family protein [Defluviicoccus sp.]MDE0276850.1 phosphoadenosine phosphosulfate reductase family protein [Defluviicoccus sp.]